MTDNRTTERVDHPPRVREAIDELMREKDATDNRTTELREKLTERGIEYETNDHMGVCETSWNGFTAMQLTPGAKLMMAFTPEQAIAATLGAEYHRYEQAAIEAWESIKAWNERAMHGTLTADDVLNAVYEHGARWQAIADELNARAERTCEPTEEWCCDHCGADLIECNVGVAAGGGAYELDPPILVNYCPNCGARVIGG